MRSFQERLPDFAERGIEIFAISVDPAEVSRDHAAEMGITFSFLSDPAAEVIRRYDLFHPGAGEQGDLARPAEFLVDPNGTVRWVDLTDDYWVRTRPEIVLEAYDAGP